MIPELEIYLPTSQLFVHEHLKAVSFNFERKKWLLSEVAYRLAKQADVVVRLVDQVHLGLYYCVVEYVHKDLNREGYHYYETDNSQDSWDYR